MSTNKDRLEDLLFSCIVAVGVREEGAFTDLDTLIIDRQKAVDELETFIARSNITLLERLVDELAYTEEYADALEVVEDKLTNLRANHPRGEVSNERFNW